MSENIILTDFKKDNNWEFAKELSKACNLIFYCKYCISNGQRKHKINNIIRIYKYFYFPLIILFNRRRYNTIVAWQQFYGLNYAFWSRLFHLKKINNLVVLTFIYKKKRGLLGYLYHRYMSYIINSGYVDLFVCFSKEECNYYNELFKINKIIFKYIPLGIENCSANYNDEKLKQEEFIFSTGRSNRDYESLVNCIKNTNYKLVIACDEYKKSSSKNIIIENNCFGDKMKKYLANSKCIVIPLKNKDISAGQLVILQAFQLKIPIIVSKSKGIEDYITNEYNGLTYENMEDLILCINKIYENKKLSNSLTDNGYNEFIEKHSLKAMAINISNFIKTI